MEANHPNCLPEGDPPSVPEASAPERGDEGTPTRYAVSTTAKPTVRLFNVSAQDPAHAGAVRSGSIRVGVLPKNGRLLRTPALTPTVDSGWTRPAAVKPFVTRSFSGLRIRSGDQLPASPDSAPESPDSAPNEDNASGS